jgi:tetratricopeptide (TPR) repeat protein
MPAIGGSTATLGGDAPAAQVQPGSLLDANQLALVGPVAKTANGRRASGSAAFPPVRDPQVMNNLALYRLSIGDVDAASDSVDRAVEWLSSQKSSLSSRELDRFNRFQVDIRASMAGQHFNRQELAIAQTEWFEATNLANSIVTPDERAQAFSKLARTLHEVQASTAKDYFNRAIETARLVSDPLGQVVTLSAIGRDLARTSRGQQSQDLFGRATVAVEAVKDPGDRLVALAILAKHRAEAGDTTTAKSLLSTLAKQMESFRGQFPPALAQHRAEAFSALALNLANLRETMAARSEFAAALIQAQELADPEMQANALLYLARDIAMAGDRKAAAKLAAAVAPKN